MAGACAAEDADFAREIGVEGGGPVHFSGAVDVGVGALGEGVDAGVRAAGAVDGDAAAAEGGECGFEVILDGAAAGLALPAAKGGAVVCDDEAQAHQSARRATESR